jgi:hypothetical protein
MLAYMDILNAIGGVTQLINIFIPDSATTLYLSFYNFDLPEVTDDKTYNLLIQFSNNIKICTNCPLGTTIGSGLSCQCNPCPSNSRGIACQYTLTTLQGSAKFTVYNTQNKYFVVASSGSATQLTVQEVTATNTVVMYVQYDYPAGMLAGKLNSYYSQAAQPLQLTVSSNGTAISVPASQFDVLITFRNFGSVASTVTLGSPTSSQSSSDLTVILAVVFSLLGVALVVIVLCRIRKCLIVRHSTVNNASLAVLANPSSLTDEEINKYFPEVNSSVLFSAEINASLSNGQLNASESANRC